MREIILKSVQKAYGDNLIVRHNGGFWGVRWDGPSLMTGVNLAHNKDTFANKKFVSTSKECSPCGALLLYEVNPCVAEGLFDGAFNNARFMADGGDYMNAIVESVCNLDEDNWASHLNKALITEWLSDFSGWFMDPIHDPKNYSKDYMNNYIQEAAQFGIELRTATEVVLAFLALTG
jgi:hypothetical protein